MFLCVVSEEVALKPNVFRRLNRREFKELVEEVRGVRRVVLAVAYPPGQQLCMQPYQPHVLLPKQQSRILGILADRIRDLFAVPMVVLRLDLLRCSCCSFLSALAVVNRLHHHQVRS